MNPSLFSVCFLIAITSQPAAADNRQHRQHDLSRYIYRQQEQHNSRPVRQAQDYKYEFDAYNDVHPRGERERKHQKYDKEKVIDSCIVANEGI